MSAPAESVPPEALLRLFLEQSKDHAVLVLTPQGRVMHWFGAAEQVFGYRADEMVGQSLTRLFTPEDAGRGLDRHELRVAEADGRAEDDRWLVRKDGSRFWASGVLLALRDPGGRLIAFAKVLRDRTDLKGQLQAAEDRCEQFLRADRRKNVFLGTLAHELRNPLTPLANAVEVIRLAAPHVPSLEYPLRLIERQVEFIRRLVDDLLDVTRVGVGKIALHVEPVNLNDLLDREVEAVRPSAADHRLELQLLMPSTTILLSADPARLRQIVSNLLTNAIKYTPPGGRVWVKATVEEDEAVVRVEDTGVGISAAMLPRIFELFTQEPSSQGRSEGGLGLGLPLVRELAALHGGSVQVRSEGKGKGSEFTVRLPLHPEPGPVV